MSHLLHDDIAILLRSPRLPGRLNSPQTAALLGFQPHDIPVLVAKKLLRPLGKPVPQAPKYFAAPEIEKLATDPVWLGKAAQAMCDHWKGKKRIQKRILPRSGISDDHVSWVGSHRDEQCAQWLFSNRNSLQKSQAL